MGRPDQLASIYDDDDSESVAQDTVVPVVENGAEKASAAPAKKFAPVIPAARRRRTVVDDEPPASSKAPSKDAAAGRRPLNTRATMARTQGSQPAIVSGPFSLGPAAMARVARTPSSGLSAESSGRVQRLVTTPFSATASDARRMLEDTVEMEREFTTRPSTTTSPSVLKPVMVTTESSATGSCASFDRDSLYLFQMPPVLPPIHGTTPSHASSVANEDAEKWPLGAQGHYGRLRRHKSGKLTLLLPNDMEFVVEPSALSDTTQLTSVLAVDPEYAQSFNLGPVCDRFVCIPALEKLSLHPRQ